MENIFLRIQELRAMKPNETITLTGTEVQELLDNLIATNPLTFLPGNATIESMLNKMLLSGKKFALLYPDFDNFKPFNDVYGFLNGDKVIKMGAEVIQKAAKDCFVGHIGGDDFVVITSIECAEEIAKEIIREFNKRILEFYPEEAQRDGFFEAKDRRGNVCKFPLTSISIGIVTNEKREFCSITEIAFVAAEVKKVAKSIPEKYFIDRRTN